MASLGRWALAIATFLLANWVIQGVIGVVFPAPVVRMPILAIVVSLAGIYLAYRVARRLAWQGVS